MKGSIHEDVRGKCSCGGKFKSTVFLNYKVPVCENCGNYPSKLRIIRYLPTYLGNGKSTTIRYTPDNRRLTSIEDAIYTLKHLDKEINQESFDPRKYGSLTLREKFKFKNFVSDYIQHQELRFQRGEITPAGLKDKKTLIKNHLVLFFGEYEVDKIATSHIYDFFDSYKDRFRTRDKAVDELRVVLKFAQRKQLIPSLPAFPETGKSNFVDGEQFIDIETQQKIIEAIDNPIYRACIKTLSIYMMRPCEVRALKWGDLDFKKGIITIERHFSLNQVTIGRKSQKRGDKKAVHRLPITQSFLEAIQDFPISLNKDEFIFKGAKGGPISQNTLTRIWNKAAYKIGIKGVSLYQGTKHAGLSNLVRKGLNETLALKISGHTTTDPLKRYAQVKVEDIRNILEK